MMSPNKSNTFRIVVVGGSSVGKTSLIRRFMGLPCSLFMEQTNYDFLGWLDQKQSKIEVFDTSGKDVEEGNLDQVIHCMNWADGIVLVYSIDNKESFLIAERMAEIIKGLEQKIPFVLVGNKLDLDKSFKRLIEGNEGIELAKKLKIVFLETSSRNNLNVNKMFNALFDIINQKYSATDSNIQRIATSISDFSLKAKEELIVSGRYLIMDSIVHKVSQTNQKKEKYLLLFNDYLVVSKPKGGVSNSQCKQAIHLSKLVLIDGSNDKDHYTFTVLNLDNNKQYEFSFQSENEKNSWIDSIEETLSDFKSHPTRIGLYDEIIRYQLKSTNTTKTNRRIFGVPLRYLIKKQSSDNKIKIPLILSDILTQLEKEENLGAIGLFRMTESKENLQKIRNIYNTGKECDLSQYKCASLTSLLLLFLKQMPNTIICIDFNEILFSLDYENVTADLKFNLVEILSCLPKDNYNFLSSFMIFLSHVVSYSKLNKMALNDAAEMFSRHIIQCTDEFREKAIAVTSVLIANAPVIFKNKIIRNGFLQPAPNYLIKINNIKANKLKDFKTKLLYLFNLVKERGTGDIELGSHLQAILITINSLLSYDLLFVQELVDITYFDIFYFLLSELERVLTKSKKALTSKVFKLNHSDKSQFVTLQAQLQYELENIYSYLDTKSNWSADERTAYFKIKKGLERNIQMIKELGFEENKSFDEYMELLHPIFSDKDARMFWDTNFGLEKFVVNKDIFISALTENETTDQEKRILSDIFDHSHTGSVNIFRFSQFLFGFGSLKTCVHNALRLFNEVWFYGFISHEDAVRLLELEKPGTFLVGFTNSIPGNFSIEYVASNPLYPELSSDADQTLEIQTINISNSPHGFHLGDFRLINDSNKLTRKESVRINRSIDLYPTIQAIFQRNSKKFIYPFKSTYYKHVWFHGNISLAETLQQLHEKPEGTFLLRFSTEIGCLTCSFVCRRGPNLSIEHFKLERLGSKIKQGTKTYDSIEECVEANSKWLTIPFEKEHRNERGSTIIEEGTVEKIVEKLYDGTDFSATTVFLLTYRSFAAPSAILHILRERFGYYKGVDEKKYRLRIGNFLKVWIQEYFWDIKDDKEFIRNCNALIQNIISEPSTSSLGKQLQTQLQNQIDGYESRKLIEESKPMRADRVNLMKPITNKGIDLITNNNIDDEESSVEDFKSSSPSLSSSTDAIFGKGGSMKLSRTTLSKSKKSLEPKCVLDIDCQELAQQLTLIEHELFTKIATHEFLNQGWLKSDKEERSPNLLKMIRFSNLVIRWVVTEILMHDKVAMRVKTMEYFVNLTKELMKIKNYNGVLEIIAGFGSSSVGRMKKTWSIFSKSKKKIEYDEFSDLLATDQNWAAYRAAFSKSAPPKIPYLGLTLTDLVFVEDGNPDRLSNGHLNWIKCERMAEVLHNVQLCQQDRYMFSPDESIVDLYLFETANILSIDDLFKRSLELEPRTAKKPIK